MSARQLASELEVSQRTILRDIEALGSAGIPVYAVRGRLGGFQLLDGFTSELLGSRHRSPQRPAAGGIQRAQVRISPRGRRLAALSGRPEGIRIRRGRQPVPGREDWTEAWVRIDSPDAAVLDILALGAEAEVVNPADLRARIASTALQIAAMHRENPPSAQADRP